VRARSGLLLALGLFAALPCSDALAAEKRSGPWRIGVLSSGVPLSPSAYDPWKEFARGLRDLGYVEGKDVIIEWRFASGNYSRFPGLAEELVRLPVDVIVTDGTPPTVAAQHLTTSIPIVFSSVGDAVGSGVVQSMAHPGGNTTGVSILLNDLIAKEVEMLVAAVPALRRVGFLQNPQNVSSQVMRRAFLATTEKSGKTPLLFSASNRREIEGAFAQMRAARVEGFVMVRDRSIDIERLLVAELAIKNRIPWIAGHAMCAEAGGLMTYGAPDALTWGRAATYVDKILKGARPADLPVEQPTKFELVINNKTAKALGLTIPPELLLQADRVIE
jgi:putative tryptophan/tyrosine transport system substrate-binding protein